MEVGWCGSIHDIFHFRGGHCRLRGITVLYLYLGVAVVCILCLLGEGWIEEGLGGGGGGGLSLTARDSHVATLCRRCTRGRGMKEGFERRDVGVGLYFHGAGVGLVTG